MKFVIILLIILNSFICKANENSDTLKLKSVEIYSWASAKYAESPYAFDVNTLIELVLKTQGREPHGTIDTIYNPEKLAEFDSMCRQNKFLKSEIIDSINHFKPKGYDEGDIRLVFVLNYTNKTITIGLYESNFMILNHKKYKINRELNNYLILVLNNIIKNKMYGNYR